jgi:hypothetical protein
MKVIASYVMRGPSQATLVASVTALLSLVLPPLGLLSAGAIGLVTLRNGAGYGALVSGLSTLAIGVLAWLTLGSPLPAIGVLLMIWLPILALGVLLRSSRSLALTVQTAGAMGVMSVLLIYALSGDPAAAWAQILEPLVNGPLREALSADVALTDAAKDALIGQLAAWMTGAFAAALVMQFLLGLFVARWWQAALYNPGGFGEEFRALRLGRGYGIIVLALLAVLPFFTGASLAANLLMVLAAPLLVQGLAVVHGVRALKRARPAWLVGFYVLFILAMPQSVLVTACIGLVDIWADIRRRVAPSGPVGPAGGTPAP